MIRAVPAIDRHPAPTHLTLAVRAAWCAMAIGMASWPAQPVHAAEAAQDSAAQQTYDIPTGPLGRTLASLAVNAGVALSFDPALTEGRTSQPLRGRYTPREALAQLLAGSGLELAARADGSYTLRRIPVKSVAATQAAGALRAPMRAPNVFSLFIF